MAKNELSQQNKSNESKSAETNDQAVSTTTSTVVNDPNVTQSSGSYQAAGPVEQGPEIDTFDIIEIAGIKYIIGLGLDNKMYNWRVGTGTWHLFIIEDDKEVPEPSTIDPMDDIL